MKKILILKNYLTKEYINNKKSIRVISKEFGCGKETIRRNLKKFNILCRTKIEGNRLVNRIGKNSPNFGKKFPKSSERMKGKNNPMFGKSYWKGKKRPKMAKIMKIKIKKLWKNFQYKEKQIKAILKGLKVKPNKPEKQLYKLLQKLFFTKYRYNKITIIAGLIPDFIDNKNKKIIELYGDYWHNKPANKKRDKNRVGIYSMSGYKTLIVWEHELKDIDKVKEKILKFDKQISKYIKE